MSWNETIQALNEELAASSSNGKSAGSDSVNEGSSPSEASKRVYMRDWINPEEGTGLIALTLEPAEGESGYCNYAQLELADCSRKITLEFDFHSEEKRQERLYKLNVIRSHLTHLEAWLHDTPVKERPKKDP